MAVESDEEQMILVSVDMEGFPEALVNLVREKFAKLTELVRKTVEEINKMFQ